VPCSPLIIGRWLLTALGSTVRPMSDWA